MYVFDSLKIIILFSTNNNHIIIELPIRKTLFLNLVSGIIKTIFMISKLIVYKYNIVDHDFKEIYYAVSFIFFSPRKFQKVASQTQTQRISS